MASRYSDWWTANFKKDHGLVQKSGQILDEMKQKIVISKIVFNNITHRLPSEQET